MIGTIRYKIIDKYDIEKLKDYGFEKYKYGTNDKCFFSRGLIIVDEEHRLIHIPTRPYGVIKNYISDLIEKGLVEEEEVK